MDRIRRRIVELIEGVEGVLSHDQRDKQDVLADIWIERSAGRSPCPNDAQAPCG